MDTLVVQPTQSSEHRVGSGHDETVDVHQLQWVSIIVPVEIPKVQCDPSLLGNHLAGNVVLRRCSLWSSGQLRERIRVPFEHGCTTAKRGDEGEAVGARVENHNQTQTRIALEHLELWRAFVSWTS